MNPYRLIPAVLFLFIFGNLSAQEQLGMRLERYSGIYSAAVNPANTVFTPNGWEVSLFTAEGFLENNYAWLRNTSLVHTLKNTGNIVAVTDLSRENPPTSNPVVLDYFDKNRNMYGVAQCRITGPGFSFHIGANRVAGLTTAFRSEVSSYKIPGILAYRTISDLPRDEVVNIPQTGINGMAWSEIGLHYSQSSYNGEVEMAWGVSPKLLTGYEGFYMRAQSRFDYSQRQNDTLAFGSADWDYALTLANAGDDKFKLQKQGGGLGLDAGVSWAQTDDAGSYTWRFGVSLLDLGYVKFSKTAERHRIVFDTLLTVTEAEFPSRDHISDEITDASNAFLSDPNASLAGHSFALGLPTALCLQADMPVAPKIFVSALLTQRIPLLKHSVKRPNTLALVPRYESRWWSFSLPVVLSDWRSPRVGAAARFAWLYIGSDNIGTFFRKHKTTGGDFYIGLKINAFSLSSGSGYHLQRESSPHHNRQHLNRIHCYHF